MHSNILFTEIMKALPRGVFEKITERHGGNKYSKGFGCWDHLLAMIYSQLSGHSSLRDVELAFNEQSNCHYHLGTRTIKRSTLSYSNNRRPVGIFADALSHLTGQLAPGARKDMREILKIFDSTSIHLPPEIFGNIGKSNGRITGMKVHVEYSANEQVPTFHMITAANINDIDIGKKIPIQNGATYAFDKGYMDLAWWQELHDKKCRFVSRIQKHMPFTVLEKRKPPADSNIESDRVVKLSGSKAREKITISLRLIKVKLDTGKTIEIVSNDTLAPAAEIAGIYKKRWEIEILFKWIKQNLKIKRFMGTSENAVHLQIITALIAYVLIALYRNKSRSNATLRQCLIYIQIALFERETLKERYAKNIQKQNNINALQIKLI